MTDKEHLSAVIVTLLDMIADARHCPPQPRYCALEDAGICRRRDCWKAAAWAKIEAAEAGK